MRSADNEVRARTTRRSVLRVGGTALLGSAAALVAASSAQASPATAASATDLPANQSGAIIDVRSHGATGDGVTDDTAAVQAAFDAATAGQTVFLSEGVFLVTATLTHTGAIGVVGLGQGRSRIDWAGAGDALVFQLSTPKKDYLLLSSFTVNATRADAGTAITANWTSPGSGAWPHALIEDVEITRNDGAGQLWQRGLLLAEAWRSTLRTVSFQSAKTTGVGVELEGQCVDCNLTDLHFSTCETPILLGAATEGTVIDNAVCVGTVNGVKCRVNDKGRKGPWVTVRDSHVNSLASAVDLAGTGDCWIEGNLFYKTPHSTHDYTAIKLSTCRNISVGNNEIYNLSAEKVTNKGIDISDSIQVHVEGNKIIDLLTGPGVALTATTDSHITSNFARNMSTGLTIDAASVGNIISLNTYRVTNPSVLTNPKAIINGSRHRDNLIANNLDRQTS